MSFTSGGRIDNDSYAAFTQLTYSLTERSRLTVGGRYTREQKRFTPDQFVAAISPAVSDFLFGLAPIFRDVNGTGGPLAAGSLLLPSVEKSTSIHKFTPTLSLDYRLVESTMLYASYGRGFKSGGFTQRVFPPLTQVPSFGPESLDSVEVGFKSELFERRLRVNATAFYSDYKDMQTLVTVFVAPTVQNAGRATIKGSELELEAVTAPWLRFGASAGYTDAKYTEISPAAAPITLASKLPNVPKLTGTVSTTADVFDSERLKGSLRLDWTYKGSHFKDAVNTPQLRQGGYGLLNVIAKLATPDERWAVSAGVNNATNKKHLVTGYADLSGAGNVYGVFSRPAEWFVNVRYRQ
jgi:iron complex outermembrane receptor protein